MDMPDMPGPDEHNWFREDVSGYPHWTQWFCHRCWARSARRLDGKGNRTFFFREKGTDPADWRKMQEADHKCYSQ
jgi:hypothetical protein